MELRKKSTLVVENDFPDECAQCMMSATVTKTQLAVQEEFVSTRTPFVYDVSCKHNLVIMNSGV